MEINKIREKYFEHFKEQKHKIIPSASLLPENDPTTLFTSSGMQPLVPYFLGEKHPEGKRLVNSQKCIRAGDIEEVGDNRHTTFFEMLGNWSLGDYFKKEQIPWVFSFLTEKLELDPARIYVTVFSGNESLSIPRDEESVALWQNSFKEKEVDAIAVEDSDTKGMQDGRIF
jgi:alanyl-tRNA synthetase